MKELLLLGGSHMGSLIGLLNGKDGRRFLPENCRLKIVVCSDLDFTCAVAIDSAGNIDCQRHPNLKQACLEAYNQTFITYDHDRIIALSLGSWHHAADDPIWLTRCPSDLRLANKNLIPLSLNEVVERIRPEVLQRVRIVKRLLETRNRFFVIPVPPTHFFHEASVAGIPPSTVLYIHSLCAFLFEAALKTLKIPYVDNQALGLEPNKYLRPELGAAFGNSHAKILEYGRLIWPNVEQVLKSFDG